MGFNSGLQLLALLNVNKASVIIYGKMRSHVTKERRMIEYFNDVMVMWISYSMICMTDFVRDDMAKFYNGFMFIAIFGVVVLGDLCYISNIIYTRLAWNNKMERNKEKYIKFTEELFEKSKEFDQG